MKRSRKEVEDEAQEEAEMRLLVGEAEATQKERKRWSQSGLSAPVTDHVTMQRPP